MVTKTDGDLTLSNGQLLSSGAQHTSGDERTAETHYPRRDKDLTSHEGVLGPPGNMDLTSQEGVLGPPSCCQPNHSALITDRNQTDYDVTDSGGQTDKR